MNEPSPRPPETPPSAQPRSPHEPVRADAHAPAPTRALSSPLREPTPSPRELASGPRERALAPRAESMLARTATRAAVRAAPVARRTLQAVALTLAAEHALRAAGGLALAVVSATRAPQPLAPPSGAALAGRRLRTVVTDVTIVERRARR